MKTLKENRESGIFNQVENILNRAKMAVVAAVNKEMVWAYYKIGEIIVLEEQKGELRAEYGQFLIKDLSERLTLKFGKGFSVTNIKQMRTFFLTYSKGQTLSDQFNLSWSHYLFLMRIDNPEERSFYEIETLNSSWSLREMKRQFESGLYERLVLSRDKDEVKRLSKAGLIVEQPVDAVKDPYILEFLGLPEKQRYSESELEQRLIDKLEDFLLELGKGYTFVGRQVRISFDEKHFYVDLVFYNRLLQCFVLTDLKIGEISHQDLGQMQMYVNYYDRFVKLEHENKTIGIVLCKKKDNTLVEITLPENNQQIFASKYQTVLPSKQELKQLIENNNAEK